MNNDDNRKLEDFIQRALRELPARRAPATLERRVLAALAERRPAASRSPGFGAWPVVPRMLVSAAGAAAALAIGGAAFFGMRAAAAFWAGESLQAQLPWLAVFGNAMATVADSVGALVAANHAWMLGALVLFAFAYAAMVLIGAGLYRTLSTTR